MPLPPLHAAAPPWPPTRPTHLQPQPSTCWLSTCLRHIASLANNIAVPPLHPLMPPLHPLMPPSHPGQPVRRIPTPAHASDTSTAPFGHPRAWQLKKSWPAPPLPHRANRSSLAPHLHRQLHLDSTRPRPGRCKPPPHLDSPRLQVPLSRCLPTIQALSPASSRSSLGSQA
jgi:hypothetical protein